MKLLKSTIFPAVLLLFFSCSQERIGIEVQEIAPTIPFGSRGCTNPAAANYDPTAVVDDGSCERVSCDDCTYIVRDTHRHDGIELGIKPGDVICLDAAIQYGPLLFTNIVGTEAEPIIITNCGGTANIDLFAVGKSDRTFAFKTRESKHFRITGTGNPDDDYGIRVTGGSLGIQLDYLSTNFEIDHVEIYNVRFAGIMGKTDPTCDEATQRQNFTMKDIALHHNYIHDCGGEGFYIGNSFYQNGVNAECGQVLPHSIEGVKVYNNLVENSGWEGIQVGSATKGAEIFNNRIYTFGIENKPNQRNGLQLGEGTGGLCYNNIIMNGPGNGINCLGYGDNIVFNNLIVNPGRNGVFCDERFTPEIAGNGYHFINNTIINPGRDGIRLFADLVEMNHIHNNIIINPGSYEEYENNNNPRTGDKDSYIYLLNNDVNLIDSSNFFTRDISEVFFANPSGDDYTLNPNSPLVDAGYDVSFYDIINFDLLGSERPKGGAYDIGAYEQN